MKRDDLERLVRDVRSIAERMPSNTMSATERRHVSEKILQLTQVGQLVVDNMLQVEG